MTRYLRQITLPELGEDGQAKLRDSSVLIVGAGGLGSPTSIYLAAAGVGRIGLVEARPLQQPDDQYRAEAASRR